MFLGLNLLLPAGQISNHKPFVREVIKHSICNIKLFFYEFSGIIVTSYRRDCIDNYPHPMNHIFYSKIGALLIREFSNRIDISSPSTPN